MPARRSLTRAILIGVGCLALAAGCGESVASREAQLADADPFERWLAAVALAHKRRDPDERVASVLIGGLGDPWPDVRSASRRELIAMPWLTLSVLAKDLMRRRLSPLDDSAQVLVALLDCAPAVAGGDFVQRGVAFRRSEYVQALAKPGAPARDLVDLLAPCFSHADANVQLFAGACMLVLEPTGFGMWTRYRTVARDCEPQTRERLTRCILALWQGLDRPRRRAQTEFVRGRMLESPAEVVPVLVALSQSDDAELRRDALLCLLGAAEIAHGRPSTGTSRADNDPLMVAAELHSPETAQRARAALRAVRLGALGLPALPALQAAADDPDSAVRMLAHIARERLQRELEQRGQTYRPLGGRRP